MATSGSDEIKTINCCLCVEDNRTRAAEKYCLQCKDYFCSSCILLHKKFPSMREHSVLDKADFRTSGADKSFPSYPTQRCGQHQLEVITMYCEEHDEVTCPSCVALNHRLCRSIISIPEEIHRLSELTNLDDAKLNISKLVKNMEEIKASKQAQVQRLQEALDKEIKSVHAFRQELQALLESMEQETIKELRKEFSSIEAALAAETNTVESLVNSLNEAASQIRKSEGNKAQEFVCIKTSLKITARAKEVQKFQQQSVEETVSFIPDRNIKVSLQQTKTLGRVLTKQKGDQIIQHKATEQTVLQQTKTLGGVSTKKNSDKMFAPKDSLYKVKSQKDLNIKVSNDKQDCSIIGSCITEDGSLLLSDFINKKLKRMDLSAGKVKDYIDMQYKPMAVCTISNTEAAVTLDNKTVQFVSLADKLSATRTLKMNHHCFGLAYKNGQLFLPNAGKNLYIYDMNGHEKRRISVDVSGKEIFQKTYHISISTSGDRVFVADDPKGVVVLDIQGKYLCTVSDPKLSSADSICTDGRNVFVCGYSSNSIVQIGNDFTILGEVGQVDNPRSLCFDYSKERLIVTRLGNTITIFELE